jgi:alcohol dehydrogenase class IV
VQAAAWDTFGYCLNAVPGGQHSTYEFLATLINARYGLNLTADDIVEVAKRTLKEELKFNEGAEFSKIYELYPEFVRKEKLPPTNSVFDVDDAEIKTIWEKLDSFKEPRKVWEVRLPNPPSILFGAGVFQRLGERAKALNMKKVFLIAGPVMKRIGLADAAQKMLANNGIASVLFSEVEPDPPIEEIEKAGKIYKEEGCDSIVGLGGGSSMDAAKAVAVRVTHPGIMQEYGVMVGGAGKIKPPLPPIICIPTTSGTGSEVNQYAIITDTERNVKYIVLSDLLVPRLAIVDPILCKTMPPGLVAETGIDALAHCVEGYVALAVPYHPYYEALALYGVKLIGRSLRKAFAKGDDLDARSDMCMAAINGGIAFSKGLGLGHALGHVLGAHYHISHGKALVVSLLCFVRANKEACQEQFREMAFVLDGSTDLEAALTRLFTDLKVPMRLRDLDIPEKDLEEIAFDVTGDVPNMAGNPAVLTISQVVKILKEFY